MYYSKTLGTRRSFARGTDNDERDQKPFLTSFVIPPGYNAPPQMLIQQDILNQAKAKGQAQDDQVKRETATTIDTSMSVKTAAMEETKIPQKRQESQAVSRDCDIQLTLEASKVVHRPKSVATPSIRTQFSTQMVKAMSQDYVYISSFDLNGIEERLKDYDPDQLSMTIFSESEMYHCITHSKDVYCHIRLVDTSYSRDGTINPSSEFIRRQQQLEEENERLKDQIQALNSSNNQNAVAIQNQQHDNMQGYDAISRMAAVFRDDNRETRQHLAAISASMANKPPDIREDTKGILTLFIQFSLVLVISSYFLVVIK